MLWLILSRRAAVDGDVEEGTIYCGQIAGLFGELKSVREVVDELLTGARERIRALAEAAGA